MAIKMKEVVNTFADEDKTKPLTLAVKRPSRKVLDEAEKVYNNAYWDAYKSKSPLKAKINQILEADGIWDESKEKELDELDKKIDTLAGKLAAGGIKKLAARKIALDIRKLRLDRLVLLADKNDLDNRSCEAQAQNKQFNYLVSACVVDNDTDELFFKSLDDYLTRSGELAARDCANKMAEMLYGLNPDFYKELPENKFLLEYKYCNEDLSLTDPAKGGRLCDVDFNPVNKDGFRVNDAGERIDPDTGAVLNDDGTPKVEFKPFLD